MDTSRLIRSKPLWLFVAIVAVLIAARLALPSVVLRYVNQELGQLEGEVDIEHARAAKE